MIQIAGFIIILVLIISVQYWERYSRGLTLGHNFGWLRVLFPSWNFFVDQAEVPQLYSRSGPSVQDMGPWQTIYTPKRGIGALLLNPQGNLWLAENALIERLLDEVDDGRSLLTSNSWQVTVSYRLIEQWVLRQLIDSPSPVSYYQFKIGVLSVSNRAFVDRLTSPVLKFTDVEK